LKSIDSEATLEVIKKSLPKMFFLMSGGEDYQTGRKLDGGGEWANATNRRWDEREAMDMSLFYTFRDGRGVVTTEDQLVQFQSGYVADDKKTEWRTPDVLHLCRLSPVHRYSKSKVRAYLDGIVKFNMKLMSSDAPVEQTTSDPYAKLIDDLLKEQTEVALQSAAECPPGSVNDQRIAFKALFNSFNLFVDRQRSVTSSLVKTSRGTQSAQNGQQNPSAQTEASNSSVLPSYAKNAGDQWDTDDEALPAYSETSEADAAAWSETAALDFQQEGAIFETIEVDTEYPDTSGDLPDLDKQDYVSSARTIATSDAARDLVTSLIEMEDGDGDSQFT
jgi:hypothetical protein